MAEALRLTKASDSTLLSSVLPRPSPHITVRVLEDLRVLALRHLPGAAADVEALLAPFDLAPLPRPGRFQGANPWLLWSGPAECLLLSTHDETADGLLRALAPGRHALACALDRSAGCLALEVSGPGTGELLLRLLDADAIPRQKYCATRTRMVDIAAVVMRHDEDSALILIDRNLGLYAARWIAHALQALAAPR